VTESDPYAYPGSIVLENRFNIRDAAALAYREREFVTQRIREGVPSGSFDFAHLRAIHRHLFQDIYHWAGEPRSVEISKDGQLFQFQRFIETGMADIHRRLVLAHHLQGLDGAGFADKAGEIIGDVNYVHPFREGNGRTQLQYLKQLAAQAGHPIDLTALDPVRWLDASIAAHAGDYGPMSREITRALVDR
jgi:cell filamentation protein